MKDIKSKIKYDLATLRKKYIHQEKGDTSCFRYPHMTEYYHCFDSDLKNDIFLLEREEEEAILGFGLENIDILRNVSDKAYYAYIFNLLHVKLTEEEKYEAYKGIISTYKKKTFKNSLKGKYHKINFKNIKINEPYDELKNYINRSYNFNTIMYKVKENNMRNIASSIHGTNLLYIDKNDYNYGIGLIKAIINNEEGIKGKNLEYINEEEVYSKIPYNALREYIKDTLKIDPDYEFIIAYLALAFQDKNTTYNGIYALLEPFMKLLFSTINMHDILEYIFNKDETLMKEDFNKIYPDFYEKIYKNKSIFKRIDILREMALYFNYDVIELYKIIFNKESILNTNIDYKVIAFIYLSNIKDNKTLIYDLLVNCYPWSVENKEIITLENWSKHILLKYGEQTFNKVKKEYNNVKNILEKL